VGVLLGDDMNGSFEEPGLRWRVKLLGLARCSGGGEVNVTRKSCLSIQKMLLSLKK
jgi:hypothetical protein